MKAEIRPYILAHGVKNPEYLIDSFLADRKGIKSEKGIKDGFSKAMAQNCKVIVIDLDMHMRNQPLRSSQIAKYFSFRHDFSESGIVECYIVS